MIVLDAKNAIEIIVVLNVIPLIIMDQIAMSIVYYVQRMNVKSMENAKFQIKTVMKIKLMEIIVMKIAQI